MDNHEKFAQIVDDLSTATSAIEDLTLAEESLSKKADSIAKSVESIQRIEKSIASLFDRLSGTIDQIERLYSTCDILIRRLEDTKEKIEALDLPKACDEIIDASSTLGRGCELVVRKLDEKGNESKPGPGGRKKK